MVRADDKRKPWVADHSLGPLENLTLGRSRRFQPTPDDDAPRSGSLFKVAKQHIYLISTRFTTVSCISMSTKPPFSVDVSIPSTFYTPAAIRDEYYTPYSPTTDTSRFLQNDLSVECLNRIHKYLWLAGRPMPPRPLNYQTATSRQIVPDERIDMHMVWEPSRRIHLKPLPRYLLSHQFWKTYLICKEPCPCMSNYIYCQTKRGDGVCQQKHLYKCGLGLLYSYISLIERESDFAIAQDQHLLPHDVTWEMWVKLVKELLENGATNPEYVNARYLFGELRLSRLNKIYMFRYGSILRGYHFTYQTYTELFYDYLTPLTATIVYVALALTAMQVGLATKLGGNVAFQNASYGFTVFSIIGPLIILLLIAILGFIQFINNLLATLQFKRERFAHYNLLSSHS
ncbi:uncharacterized protein BO87DRAFT_404404 [Aspergillus neoniger CBS 115656]|uniref:Subtilisin-like serine protease n=1 Tax=Aspergillus neoniger (strain CBS 115656) TaxID=1448310 RepID=A0A318ZAL6_ASPNB|nr:hypothetical protein BO87DRAFT_404404 [Aspergillus neoniger CBS 115656]PYH37328.1 hypothetical protein BO87DRAFT_404404 [Aspergillus neoniger CBS 115656]